MAEEKDHEVNRLIKEAEGTARDILSKNKAKLTQLAEYLGQIETLESTDLETAFKADPSVDLMKLIGRPERDSIPETPPTPIETSEDSKVPGSPLMDSPEPEAGTS